MSETRAEISPTARSGCAGGTASGHAVLRRSKSDLTLAKSTASMPCKLAGDRAQHAFRLPNEAPAVLIFHRFDEFTVFDRGFVLGLGGAKHLHRSLDGEGAQRRCHEALGDVEGGRQPLLHHFDPLLVGALAFRLHGLGQGLQVAGERGDLVQFDVFLELAIELLGRMQEVRQGLVPKFLRDQLISDQQMSPHQGDIAIKADAGVPRPTIG